MKNKYLNFFGLLLIIIISLIVSIFFGSKKEGFHEDEYYSYYSTNYTNGWAVTDASWVYSDRYIQEFMVLDGEEFNYSQVKTVQSWDVHPPMYYWFLHTICSFWKNTFSKWQGLFLNIFFYLYGIVFLFLCTLELKADKNKINVLGLFITLAYALNAATISGLMFIRMYAMISGLIISSLYIHIKAMKFDFFKHSKKNIIALFLIALNLYVGALTHYYFVIYHFIISLFICIYLLIKDKSIKRSFIYGVSCLISIGLAVLTFPSTLNQLFSGYRGTEATSNLFNLSNTFDRLIIFFNYFIDYIFKNWIVFILFIALFIYILCKKQIRIKVLDIYFGLLSVVLVFYYFIIAKTGLLLGDDSLRYILPIFSLVYLLIYKVLDSFEYRSLYKYIGLLLTLGLIIMDILNLSSNKVLFLYSEDSAKVEFAKQHCDIPVVYIYGENNSWKFLDTSDEFMEYKILGFFCGNSTQVINDAYINSCNEILIYIDNESGLEDQLQRIQNSNPLLKEYKLISESKYFNLYYFSTRVE